MNNKKYEILSILDYPISENLFKEKIGTGEELRELQEKDILSEITPGYFMVDFDFSEINNINNVDDTKKLHQDMIDTYYLKNLDNQVNSDYPIFMKGHLEYINISYHYRALLQFDKAIENIFIIAKKLVFWGFGYELMDELNNYESDQLKDINKLWKEYYKFFFQLMHPYGDVEESEFFEFIKEVEISLKEKHILYFDSKNLEGIFYKNIKNDEIKAIGIFEELIKDFKLIDDISCKDMKLSYARILENLAICKKDDSIKMINEYFDEAEKIFKEYDEYYELSKLYYFKLYLLNNNEENMPYIIQEHDNLSSILMKYTFPDVERSLFNFLSNKSFIENKHFGKYMEIKIESLTRDMVLYFEYFMNDLYDILYEIEDNWGDKAIEINDGIDLLLDFLEEVELADELYFIKGIKSRLMNEDIEKEIDKIKDESLKEFAYKYINRLK